MRQLNATCRMQKDIASKSVEVCRMLQCFTHSKEAFSPCR